MAKNDSGIQEEVDRLMAMGLSFEEHGQIKPITGSWVSRPKAAILSSRSRPASAASGPPACSTLLRTLKDEPLLRVEVVSNPTRMRQVLENRHAEPPSAVGQACEVASLILSELGISPHADTDRRVRILPPGARPAACRPACGKRSCR